MLKISKINEKSIAPKIMLYSSPVPIDPATLV